MQLQLSDESSRPPDHRKQYRFHIKGEDVVAGQSVDLFLPIVSDYYLVVVPSRKIYSVDGGSN